MKSNKHDTKEPTIGQTQRDNAMEHGKEPDMETPTTEEAPEEMEQASDDGKEEGSDSDDEEDLHQEIEQLKDDYLRLRAEYDNYRKRTLKEKSDLIKYGGEKMVSGFLDIMDDIELAIKNMSEADSIDGLVEGVEIIQNKFIGTLKAQGVSAMEVIGTEFDADIHDAVALVPTEDPDQKGKVIDCVQTGYTLNDKVIRHPKVVVGE